MAKKKIKFSVPDVNEIWADAFVLLQYAFRIERGDASHENDEPLHLMLSEVHEAIAGLRKARKSAARQGLEATMVNQLTDLYKRVVRGELTDEVDYRRAVRDEAGFHSEEPDGLDQVLGVLLKDKETIREERGPQEAAVQATAEYFGRGGRQLMEYRLRMKKGDLIFDPFDHEPEGFYHLHSDFIRLVLTKTLSIKPEWAAEIQKFLREKNVEEFKSQRRDLTEGEVKTSEIDESGKS